jgi:hypothetical protein
MAGRGLSLILDYGENEGECGYCRGEHGGASASHGGEGGGTARPVAARAIRRAAPHRHRAARALTPVQLMSPSPGMQAYRLTVYDYQGTTVWRRFARGRSRMHAPLAHARGQAMAGSPNHLRANPLNTPRSYRPRLEAVREVSIHGAGPEQRTRRGGSWGHAQRPLPLRGAE